MTEVEELEESLKEEVKNLSKAKKTSLIGLIMLLYSRMDEAHEIIEYLLENRGRVFFTDNEKEIHDNFVYRAERFLEEVDK